MKKLSLPDLQKKARQIRTDIIRMVAEVGKCHVGGSLSATDLLVGLYFGKTLKYRPQDPKWESRDRFILSCGHYAPAWYAVLAKAGYFDPKKLLNLRKIDSFLQGHPSRLHSDFVEVSSGSLGQGLSVGVGMAIGLRLENGGNVWVLTSDAEYQEGQTWEAIMAAAKFKLGNLKVIVDVNGIQIDGFIGDLMPFGDLVQKFKSFGWSVVSIDGHDFDQIIESYQTALSIKNKPVAIIGKTIAGKGVSFMEGKWQWHDGELTKEQFKKAIKELGG
jgi:transketolase